LGREVTSKALSRVMIQVILRMHKEDASLVQKEIEKFHLSFKENVF